MSDPEPIPLSAVLGMVGLAILSSALSPFAAIFGAMLTGLKEGGWNWQFIGYFAIGLYAGVVSAGVCLGIGLAIYNRRPGLGVWLPLVGPLALSFIIAAVVFPVQQAQDRRSSAAFREQQEISAAFLQQAAEDPMIVIRERWLDQRDRRPLVLSAAMHRGKDIPFTAAQLTEIYETWDYPLVILHPACSTEFLETHLEDILTNNAGYQRSHYDAPDLTLDYYTLQAVFTRHTFSTSLLQHIASLEHLPRRTILAARKEVEKRETLRQRQEQLTHYIQQAQQDPSVVIRERWLDNPGDHRAQAIHTSMAEGSIPFSQEQLITLLHTWHYPWVVLHPSCTHEFLEMYLATALARSPRRHRNDGLMLSDLKHLFARETFPPDLLDRIVNRTYANDLVDRHELGMAARAAREVLAEQAQALSDKRGSDAEGTGDAAP